MLLGLEDFLGKVAFWWDYRAESYLPKRQGEKKIGRCRVGRRYETGFCVITIASHLGYLEYDVMRDKKHVRNKMSRMNDFFQSY